MKVLLYSANYAPEPTGIGKYSGEMAVWIAAAGHDVRVVSAPPYYPKWNVADGYSASRYRREHCNGVDVWRTPIWLPKVLSGVNRILHLLSFAITSFPVVLRQALWRPDVVMTVVPAFVCAPGGLWTAKLAGAKSWIHVQDFEVDVAFRLGLLEGQTRLKMASWLECKLLQSFDRVSSISNRMLQRAAQKGVQAGRLLLLPNWTDLHDANHFVRPDTKPFREVWAIHPGETVALYSGSLGAKHGLALLPRAARMLPTVKFVICGDGVMKEQLQRDTADLQNVIHISLQPAEQLQALLASADIHLLPQNDGAEDLVMPSKLAGMMASGRPTVATCRQNTEIAKTLDTCGIVVPPGDDDAFFAAVRELAENEPLRVEMGARARVFAEANMGRQQVLSYLLVELGRLTGKPSLVADVICRAESH